MLAESEGELCLCAVTRLEILFSARSAADCEALEAELGCSATCGWIPSVRRHYDALAGVFAFSPCG